MSLDYFDVEKGLRINTEQTFTQGSGDPTADEPVGSVYLEDDGTLWQKRSAGAGTPNWRRMATEEFVNNLVDGRSWREPVAAHDDDLYANVAAAEANLNGANDFDGVTLGTGDRVLLSNLTSGNENVYIVNGTPGAGATLVEDTNLATDGDAVWVEAGTTWGDTTWAYNGTVWVQFGAGDQTELGYIRAFIGKGAAGNEMPAYTNNNFITDSDSLEESISDLDGQLKLTDDKVNESYAHVTADGVTAITTLDSFLVDTAAMIEWIVYAQGSALADAARKEGVRIQAIHDGHNVSGGADATSTDYAVSNKLKIGANLGITYDVDVSGSGAAQTMRLRVSASTSSNFRAVRRYVKF